ncbi:MAG: Ig-like domain-containing protein [Opitutaceae bacterium]
MKRWIQPLGATVVIALACSYAWGLETASEPEINSGWTLMTWNDLGMHCMDEDFAVFAILPPFNTLNAQLIDRNGNRITGTAGIELFYQAATDPDGSETKTSSTGTNFWEHADELFGATMANDTGLFANKMPGVNNNPQPMHWNDTHEWWTAEGIPIIPTDKWGDTQAYPLIRVTARQIDGTLLAETVVTAPVSAEMNCVSCHASNASAAAMPTSGWQNDPDPVRDYRMNILRLHDSKHLTETVYLDALAEHGYNLSGLAHTVTNDSRAILCASCHASNALSTNGSDGVPPLTQAMHAGHSDVADPITGLLMNASENRTSCYQCHPGKETRCLRGAMGRTSDAFGQPLMSCQSCHGNMETVGANTRTGWFDEPNCQSCHTGTYTNHSGAVRFTSSFDNEGNERVPADARFATNPDTPAPGISLFRFSKGHGDMKCSACHGSPHAIYPTSERNDNLQSLAIQGHIGTIGDCSSCHQNDTARTRTIDGGPHGMHGIGNWWVEEHHDVIPENNDSRDATQCKACHGLGLTGGVLSQALGPRTLNTQKGGPTITYWQGQRVSCYDCHAGPNESDHFRQAKPTVQNFSLLTAADTTAGATLLGTDADTADLSYRIISPPSHGTLAISGALIAYTPNPGFVGTDLFTYCAMDNRTDSNLGIVHIEIGDGANTADHDGDGIADLVERAFGLSTSRVSRGNAPDYKLYEDSEGQQFIQATYNPSLIPDDLELIFEACDDLNSWDTEDLHLSRNTNSAGNVVVRLALAQGGADKHFLRCRVQTK